MNKQLKQALILFFSTLVVSFLSYLYADVPYSHRIGLCLTMAGLITLYFFLCDIKIDNHFIKNIYPSLVMGTLLGLCTYFGEEGGHFKKSILIGVAWTVGMYLYALVYFIIRKITLRKIRHSDKDFQEFHNKWMKEIDLELEKRKSV